MFILVLMKIWKISSCNPSFNFRHLCLFIQFMEPFPTLNMNWDFFLIFPMRKLEIYLTSTFEHSLDLLSFTWKSWLCLETLYTFRWLKLTSSFLWNIYLQNVIDLAACIRIACDNSKVSLRVCLFFFISKSLVSL